MVVTIINLSLLLCPLFGIRSNRSLVTDFFICVVSVVLVVSVTVAVGTAIDCLKRLIFGMAYYAVSDGCYNA